MKMISILLHNKDIIAQHAIDSGFKRISISAVHKSPVYKLSNNAEKKVLNFLCVFFSSFSCIVMYLYWLKCAFLRRCNG